MRLTLMQMNSRTAARDENIERACAFIGEAAEGGSDLGVLPEFFNNEYFPQYRDASYMEYAETEDGYTQQALRALHHLRNGPSRPILRHRHADRPRWRDPRQVPQGSPGGLAEPGENLLPRRIVVPGFSLGRMDSGGLHLL